MTALIRKEIRLLLPAWVAAMLVAALAPKLLREPPWTSSAMVIYALAAMILGIASFGQEISAGTLGLYMAQPISRRRLWRAKAGVAAIAVALTWVIPCVLLASRSNWLFVSKDDLLFNSARWMQIACAMTPIFIAALAGLAGGLWTTLLFRQIAVAFWTALLIPLALCLPVQWILDRCQVAQSWQAVAWTVELAVYGAAGFWAARSLFMRAQDVQWTGPAISLSFDNSLTLAPVSWLPHGPWKSLIQKEIQLHQTTFLIVVIILALHLGAIAARKFMLEPSTSGTSVYACLGMIWGLWMFVPLILGSTALAEERNMNTLGVCLCLPVKRRIQLFIKLSVVLVPSLIFGGILPAALEWLGEEWGVKSEAFAGDHTAQMITLSFAAVGVSALAFYVSTLTRNLLQAMGVTVVLAIAGMTIQNLWSYRFSAFCDGDTGTATSAIFMGLVVLLCLLTYRNAGRLHADTALWNSNFLAVFGMLAAITITSLAIHLRTWEFFMPLEPAHAQGRLQGQVRPKICPTIGSLFLVLLPDGRLWEAQKYETKVEQRDIGRSGGTPAIATFHVPAVPISGEFIGSSNWVDVAYTSQATIGLQADGTLWRLGCPWRNFTNFIHSHRVTGPPTLPAPESFLKQKPVFSLDPPKIQQIGTDTDWRSIAPCDDFYLAVKTDGTLWTGGWDETGKHEGDSQSVSNLELASSESNWQDVLTGGWDHTFAVKRDGSLWKIGGFKTPDAKSSAAWIADHTQFVQGQRKGTNWVFIRADGTSFLALDREGTLHVNGHYPNETLGYRITEDPRQRGAFYIGPKFGWKAVSGDWPNSMVVIKENGTLEIFDWDWRTFHNRTSRNSDWIALAEHQNSVIALAADGTLSSWERYGMGFTMASRKPIWNVNILK